MNIKFDNKQFDFLIDGSAFNDTNRERLRSHYVNGVELKVIAEQAGFSSPSRVYTLIKQFESFVEKKILANDLSMITVITGEHNKDKLITFDASRKGKLNV